LSLLSRTRKLSQSRQNKDIPKVHKYNRTTDTKLHLPKYRDTLHDGGSFEKEVIPNEDVNLIKTKPKPLDQAINVDLNNDMHNKHYDIPNEKTKRKSVMAQTAQTEFENNHENVKSQCPS